MSKYIYAATIQKADNGKLFAEALRISTSKNLAAIIRDCYNILALNILPTKKDAIELAHKWEDDFLNNGTAYFDRNYVTNCFDL